MLDNLYDLLRISYLILLMLNVVLYSASIILGNKFFKPLLAYLLICILTEFFNFLVKKNHLLILGEKTNAPFFFFFILIQFFSLSFFFKNVIQHRFIKKYFYPYLILISTIALIPYVLNPSLIMEFTSWLSFITMPFILFLSSMYFIELLIKKGGYPFINIGIFIVMSCSLIYFASNAFYKEVNINILDFKLFLNLLPLVLLQLLFLYEAYLFLRTEKSKF